MSAFDAFIFARCPASRLILRALPLLGAVALGVRRGLASIVPPIVRMTLCPGLLYPLLALAIVRIIVVLDRREQNKSIGLQFAGVAARWPDTPGMSGIPWLLLPARGRDVVQGDTAADRISGCGRAYEVRRGSVRDTGLRKRVLSRTGHQDAPSHRGTIASGNRRGTPTAMGHRCGSTRCHVSRLLTSPKTSTCGTNSSIPSHATRQVRAVGQFW